MRIKTKKTKKFLAKLPLIMAKHAFLSCLVLFLISLIFGAFIFYKYNILAQRKEFEGLEQTCVLEKEVYQDVLDTWQENEIIFQQADFKEYSDPFLQSVPFPGKK